MGMKVAGEGYRGTLLQSGGGGSWVPYLLLRPFHTKQLTQQKGAVKRGRDVGRLDPPFGGRRGVVRGPSYPIYSFFFIPIKPSISSLLLWG